MSEKLDGMMFRSMIVAASQAIEGQKQAINELNVFPVPDGDTGTNMSMTLAAAAAELSKKAPKTLGGAAEAAASAMLRGARGNSGVILSLLFRGLSKSLKEKKTAGAAEFAAAMNEGVNAAYKAVMKPTEGTILTVSRLASAAAAEAAAGNSDLAVVLEKAAAAGDAALKNTVEQNPVLKKAGVVDAGGMGYQVILRAFIAVLRGESQPTFAAPAAPAAPAGENGSVFAKFDTEADIHFPYCTEFIVSRDTDKSPDLLRSYLSSVGDSAVVLDDEELIKVHVHSDRPGEILTEALTYGALLSVKVENMRQQHTTKLQESAPAPSPAPAAPVEPTAKQSVVAICAGEGLSKLFRELGAEQVVSGGQTMNPSTEDILEAVDRTAGETVLILPNNKNIIMAAQQCAGLTKRNILVVPSATVPQGVAAMLAVDPEGDPGANAEAMNEAISHVTSFSVTYAARDSVFDGQQIREGDYLALMDGKLLCSEREPGGLTGRLAAALKDCGAEVVSVFYGQDVTAEQAAAFSGALEAQLPEAELSLVDGGQPVYYYLISAE